MEDTHIQPAPGTSAHGVTARPQVGAPEPDGRRGSFEPVEPGDGNAKSDVLHATWVLLDDAWQALLRAEAIVLLLGQGYDLPEHHVYGAEVASDLLGRLKGQLREAQDMLRSPGRRRTRRAA